MDSFLGIDTVVHAAGVLQDGLILPNLQKVGACKITRNDDPPNLSISYRNMIPYRKIMMIDKL